MSQPLSQPLSQPIARACTRIVAAALIAALTAACCPELAQSGRAASGLPPRPLPGPDRAGEHAAAALHPEVRATLVAAGIDVAALPCNSAVRWVRGLRELSARAAAQLAANWQLEATPERRATASQVLTGYFIRVLYQELGEQNVGVMRLRGMSYRDASGVLRPVLVFRSAVLADWDRPEGCLAALIRRANVAHVVNLYSGGFPLHDLIAREKALARRLGVTHHDEAADPRPWRKLVEDEAGYTANRRLAMERVAALIREQILAPGGLPPRGSIYLHCGGGMHRSGVVFGILRRCINRDPPSVIEAEYARHTVYVSSAQRGGYEALNLRLIREFDCALLAGPAR